MNEKTKEKIKCLKAHIEKAKENNLYYLNNSQMFDIVVDIVFNHIVTYCKVINSGKMQHVRNWIRSQLKFLDNEHFCFDDYGINEQVYLLFYGMTKFPKCPICGNVLDNPKHFHNIFIGFAKSCSKQCKKQQQQISFKNTCIDRYGVPHYASNKERYEQRCDAMEKKHGVRNVFQLESTKKTIRQTKKDKHGNEKYINIELIRKSRFQKYNGKWESDDAKEKRKQSFIEHYGVDHNMKSIEGLKAYEDSIERKYGKGIRNVSQIDAVKQKKTKTCKAHLGVEYALQSEIGQKHFQETCIETYGVPYPMQNYEIRKKAKSKYFYDNEWFDSAPEIAFYIWLKDNKIEFEHEPSPGLTYVVDNKVHTYFPDFKVDDMYFEIKGDQFFDNVGNLIDPYDHIDKNVLREKQNCMISNNVIVLRQAEYCMFELYVKQTYGCKYLKQFKIIKQVNNNCNEERNKR